MPFTDPIGGFDEIRRSEELLEFFRSGKHHRLDGPAVVELSRNFSRSSHLSLEWFENGVRHRADGPAIVTRRGRHVDSSERIHFGRGGENRHTCLIWYHEGLLHRADGPAIEWSDGWEEWLWNEDRHRVELPAVVGPGGHREYHHRDYADKSSLLPREKPDLSWWRLQGRCDAYFRERGPAILSADGHRFWGVGHAASHSSRPNVGPWIETPGGSVRFANNVERQADHPEVVALRRDLSQYATARYEALLGRDLLWLAPGNELDVQRWASLAGQERRSIATAALDAWERTRGLLHPRVESAYKAWIERFEMEASQARHEAKLLREDMRGYLAVALARLQERDATEANTWQERFDLLGLPVKDSAIQDSGESRLRRVVATVPPISNAVPQVVGTGMMDPPWLGRKTRTPAARKKLYLNGLSEIALSILASVTQEIDTATIETVALNLMVDDVDPATGADRRYCVLSMQVEVHLFRAVQLGRVDPVSCVKNFGSVVPRGDGETLAVKPILQFDKEDVRIVPSSNITSQLDARPNLMDLSPTEFETLIQNLFESIGLDTHQTRASRDGGVDAIGYDSRPIFGGKVVIQAKRYKNVVGVSAVRDLYGTVLNEGASKGILVTTSGYGAASYEFAKNKPLELLEGSHLLHLLREHLQIDAVIVPPEDWIDQPLDV